MFNAETTLSLSTGPEGVLSKIAVSTEPGGAVGSTEAGERGLAERSGQMRERGDHQPHGV